MFGCALQRGGNPQTNRLHPSLLLTPRAYGVIEQGWRLFPGDGLVHGVGCPF